MRSAPIASFLRPCRVFSKCSSPLGYVGAILKTLVEMSSQSRKMRGRYSNRTRGRKARMGLPAKCMHFVGSPGWRGNSNSPRDEQLDRACLSKMNGLIERPRARRSICTRRRGLNLTPMSVDGSLFIPRARRLLFASPPETNSFNATNVLMRPHCPGVFLSSRKVYRRFLPCIAAPKPRAGFNLD